MRILVTGANGFVGQHLISAIEAAGHEPLLHDISFSNTPQHRHWTFDLCDREAMSSALKESKPDACIHLGAISYVPDGINDPATMLNVNVSGTVNILDAVREHTPDTRVLFISTSQVYGTHPHPTPIKEDDRLRPTSLYAMSKAAADVAALGYADAHGLDILTVRPGNHTGPGQAPPFAIASFATKIKAALDGKSDCIHIGNLESERDITDVRDVVKAYLLLLKSGQTGLSYNVSSGVHMKMSALVDQLCETAGIFPERRIEQSLYRPTDQSPRLDSTRISEHTGWKPQVETSDTLRDIYMATVNSL